MLGGMGTETLLDLHIDRNAQQVRRGNEVLPVNGLSWRLLECLLSHGTDVVSFDSLAQQVWAPAVVGEDAISQRVKLLRQALGDDSRRPRYVRSVRGRGYQLCAPPQPATLGGTTLARARSRCAACGHPPGPRGSAGRVRRTDSQDITA